MHLVFQHLIIGSTPSKIKYILETLVFIICEPGYMRITIYELMCNISDVSELKLTILMRKICCG